MTARVPSDSQIKARVWSCPTVRGVVMQWEECERCLGRRFSVREWEWRFGLNRRTWTRWCVQGRKVLGLALKIAQPEEVGGAHYVTLQQWEVDLLRRWCAALEDYLVRGTRPAGLWLGLERAWVPPEKKRRAAGDSSAA